MSKTSYYLFGLIKLWTVRKSINEDELYKVMSARFKKELQSAVDKRAS